MKTIWLLSTLDRWDEDNPWDIAGYVETKEEADKWVFERASYRKAEEICHLKDC